VELTYRGYLSAAHTDIRLKPGCARAINNSPSHEYKIERIGAGPLSGRERRQTSNCHNQRNSFHSAILHGKERPFRESYAKSDYTADRNGHDADRTVLPPGSKLPRTGLRRSGSSLIETRTDAVNYTPPPWPSNPQPDCGLLAGKRGHSATARHNAFWAPASFPSHFPLRAPRNLTAIIY
jgi:hypothetical protein